MKRRVTIDQRHVVISKGTHVVLLSDQPLLSEGFAKQGTVGRVTAVDHPLYEVTTPSGDVVRCERTALTIQQRSLDDVLRRTSDAWARHRDHVILRVIVGSRAWNLADASSDTDLRGAFLLPFADQSGLFEPPDEIQDLGHEGQYWEVRKLVVQGLRADANTLEALWSPHVLEATSEGELLLRHRELFVSRRIYQSFGRYALAQFKRIASRVETADTAREALEVLDRHPSATIEELIDALATSSGCASPATALKAMERLGDAVMKRGLVLVPGRTPDRARVAVMTWLRSAPKEDLLASSRYRPKNAYNLLRLLHSGIQWLRTGEPLIGIDAARGDGLRDQLLAIKQGNVPLAEVVREAEELSFDLEAAWRTSVLPEEPDVEGAHELVVELRTRAARRQFGLVGDDTASSQVEGLASIASPAPRRFEIPEQRIREWMAAKRMPEAVVLAVTGAHAYGFPSPDSDFDLKGWHLIEASQLLGLTSPESTRDLTEIIEGLELDYTSHDAAKALRLFLNGNGNVLEQLFSPYQLSPVPGVSRAADARLAELRFLAHQNLHRRFARHYLGFLGSKRRELEREPSTKAALYLYRVALTGIHLLTEHDVLLDLPLLLESRPDPIASDLIQKKRVGHEKMPLDANTVAHVLRAIAGLEQRLIEAEQGSALPAAAPNPKALDAWLREWRTRPVL